MKCRLAILTEIIAPYRIPVFNALAARDDIDLHVIFLSETDATLRQWPVYRNEIRFSHEVLPAWRRRLGDYNCLANRGVAAALEKFQPEAVLCGGYNYIASWQAAWWCKKTKLPLLLWSESTAHDTRRRSSVVEFLKKCFTSHCTAFAAAGKSSRDYLIQLGAPEDRIFIAPDAVDVDLYTQAAERARRCTAEVRARHNLPKHYFLYAGRLVVEKGVFDLLASYATLEAHERSQTGLVFAGDGACASELAKRAARISPGCVRFTGFVHREQLAELYALAEALVFPTHSDPWGLVVNEAMACGLPIIASDVAGCVADLVADGENGFVVPAGEVAELTSAMHRIVNNPEQTSRMGARSAMRIQAFTPQACADGIAQAGLFACAWAS